MAALCPAGCGVYVVKTETGIFNQDYSLHICHESREVPVEPWVGVGLITYRCPNQGRQLTVGPADYTPSIDYQENFYVRVNCLCGGHHDLNLFDSES